MRKNAWLFGSQCSLITLTHEHWATSAQHISGLHMFWSSRFLPYLYLFWGLSWVSQCLAGAIWMKNGWKKMSMSWLWENDKNPNKAFCFACGKFLLKRSLKFQSRVLETPWKVLEFLAWKSVQLYEPCIHVMVHWHLPKQSIHWPVSPDHIAGSS